MYQLHLADSFSNWEGLAYRERLGKLLGGDLDFHAQDSGYASHNFHSFPAKFPPQLPRKFILELTSEGDTVLDPMAGSGTTMLEAVLARRQAVGFDIDPLALLISQVKTTPLDRQKVARAASDLVEKASLMLDEQHAQLCAALRERWDERSKAFVDYWFALDTQLQLMALVLQIEQVSDLALRAFFELAFSAIIITKSGGVSLAFDLAYTRPRKAKVVIDKSGKIIVGDDLADSLSPRVQFLTKTLRSPLEEFIKRVNINLQGLLQAESIGPRARIALGDAQSLPMEDSSVDLIVTSPPYASNAIDYMRAHKFSLVWMKYTIGDLGEKRNAYVGGESG